MKLFNKRGYITPGKRVMIFIILIIIVFVIGFLIGRGTIPTPLTSTPVA